MAKHDSARYGLGRKPPEMRRVDQNIKELYRRLLGFYDEMAIPTLNGQPSHVTVQVQFPKVESASWADVIADAARSGALPYSNQWRRAIRDSSTLGLYPPPGDVLKTEMREQTLPSGQKRLVEVISSCRIRGKKPCKECGVPTSSIYQNIHGVCYDCQLAENPSLGGGSPVVAKELTRRARRAWREEQLESCTNPQKMLADLELLDLTPDQFEVARMFIRGFTLKEIGVMTNRTEQRVNTMIGRIRKRCRQLGLLPLVRTEDRSGASRHVRNADPHRMKNI